MVRPPTSFDTAILFDIENVGYGRMKTLSIGEIIAAIRAEGGRAELVSHPAVTRAYADWTRQEYRALRNEMVENGVQPQQVFDYSSHRKNAADIELVVDAIDLAYSRPTITTFVIVSADGGFASLAKKLHELGRSVVVCAGPECSAALRAVADLFIPMPGLDEEADVAADPTEPVDGTEVPTAPVSGAPATGLGDLSARMRVALRDVAPLDGTPGPDQAVERAQSVIELCWPVMPQLADSGVRVIRLQELGNALRYAMPDFRPASLGVMNIRQFLQAACRGTRFCVAEEVRKAVPEHMVVERTELPPGCAVLEDIDLGAIPHGDRVSALAAHYRAIAADRQPLYRLPPPAQLTEILLLVAERPPVRESFESLIERVAADISGHSPTEAAKFALTSLVTAAAFAREPAGKPLPEQTVTLPERLRSGPALAACLQEAVAQKLGRHYGDVDREALREMIGELASAAGAAARPEVTGGNA